MSATVLSRLNPVSQFGFQRIVAGKSQSFFSIYGQRRLFSDCFRFTLSGRRRAMAASGSLPVFGNACLDDLFTTCANGLDFTKKRSNGGVGLFTVDCPVASMRLRKRDQMKNRLVCHYSVIDPLDKTRALFGALSKSIHTSSSSSTTCFSVGPAHELSSSPDSELSGSPTTTSSLKCLKLVSGSCYLPHPEKEATGGEDAHFICDEEQAIGVADGVGGWAEVGVNAGLFSRELMSYSVSAIRERAKGSSIDPLMVLEKAHSQTRAKGSSTACIIALTEKGLHALNLGVGDSGFTVVRDGTTVFQSPVQQHGFNFTYQLESGNGGDMPHSGQVFMIDVESGDVIVAGTDGVYDNLYNEEITGVVVSSVRAGLDPKATAQKIADLARARAVDKKRQSPFAAAAQEAGFRFYGGKLDDITAVVSYVTPA